MSRPSVIQAWPGNSSSASGTSFNMSHATDGPSGARPTPSRSEMPPLEDSNPLMASHSKDRVSYYYNPDVANYHFGEGHPMKPPRLALTHQLVLGYGLHKKMEVYCPRRASDEEVTDFHSEDYIEFLKMIKPDNMEAFQKYMSRFNLGVDDCPVFEGMYDFCRLYTGASVEAARKLMSGYTDIAINYSGGLHHAKKWEASGFCYVNDINVAILQLLRTFPRVLYIDIDVHHGDGVQEAFYANPRVMTVSFHKYDGQFFPGTGSIDEVGVKSGKYYSLNVPLQEYIDDQSYAYIFKHVMANVMETFRPSVIVLQCGADSLAADRLGCFNLSVRGHGECVKFMKSYRIPMMVLGGGGYTIRNVARCWTYETSILTNTPVPDKLPYTDYNDHFAPDYALHPRIVDPNHENVNTRHYLDSIRQQCAEYLRFLNGAPSVQMQEIPPDSFRFMETGQWVDQAEDSRPDERQPDDYLNAPRRDKELSTMDEREFYEDDRDNDVDRPENDGDVAENGNVAEGVPNERLADADVGGDMIGEPPRDVDAEEATRDEDSGFIRENGDGQLEVDG